MGRYNKNIFSLQQHTAAINILRASKRNMCKWLPSLFSGCDCSQTKKWTLSWCLRFPGESSSATGATVSITAAGRSSRLPISVPTTWPGAHNHGLSLLATLMCSEIFHSVNTASILDQGSWWGEDRWLLHFCLGWLDVLL